MQGDGEVVEKRSDGTHDKNNLLWCVQHGAMHGRSCTTPVLEVLDKWTEAIEQGDSVDAIYLDFPCSFAIWICSILRNLPNIVQSKYMLIMLDVSVNIYNQNCQTSDKCAPLKDEQLFKKSVISLSTCNQDHVTLDSIIDQSW